MATTHFHHITAFPPHLLGVVGYLNEDLQRKIRKKAIIKIVHKVYNTFAGQLKNTLSIHKTMTYEYFYVLLRFPI